MGRRSDHEPRPEVAAMCPDPEECTRLIHAELAPQDSCECCGEVIPGEYPIEEWQR